MTARKYWYVLLTTAIMLGATTWIAARPAAQNPPDIRVSVEMVQLDVAVTDGKAKYVTGLQPDDFSVAEDGIAQSMAMFAEGDSAPEKLSEYDEKEAAKTTEPGPSTMETAPLPAAAQTASLASNTVANAPSAPSPTTASATTSAADGSPLAGANVFILFDTSNYMYRGFVFAQDAIADFVRSLQGPDRIALYSYSRDLYRAARLTPDRMEVLRGVRATVAGDNAALYDATLLTLRDASKLTGRRVIVVFSNGPDNASVAPPEDVEELAQSEGVAIYMISTREAERDPLSDKVFGRISASTGGEVYFAKNWNEEKQAFAAIRNDLAHLYTLYYYPQPNPNRGWRAITVKLKRSGRGGKYRIRARSGYRPLSEQASIEGTTSGF